MTTARLPKPLYNLKPFGFSGHVLAVLANADPQLWDVALQARSIHHILRPLYSFEVSTAADALDAIHSQLLQSGMPEIKKTTAFRVITKRRGEHASTSADIQRYAGAALAERYGATVNLKQFDCKVRVDLFHSTCIVGVQVSDRPLSERHLRAFSPRTSLKANVAYSLFAPRPRLRADAGPLWILSAARERSCGKLRSTSLQWTYTAATILKQLSRAEN